MALPNPFQSATVLPPVFIAAPKATQNDGNFFHGYRSNFNINQQKQQYEQRMSQQQQQEQQPRQQQIQHKFNHNPQHHNRVYRNDANETMNHNYGANTSNWCDLCECGFKYPQQLEKHLGEHEKCWFDNCNFEGNSKLLQKHIETQHQTGLFQRVGKVESEEDIEKWREERRKRYPTRANIEARQLAQEERLKRGERISEPKNRFGNVQNRKSAQQRSFTQNDSDGKKKNHGDKKKTDKKRRRNRNNKNKSDKINQENENDTIEAGNESVKSETVSLEQKPVEQKEKTTNALASLGMYGSDTDTDADFDCDNDTKTAAENSEENEQSENVSIGVNKSNIVTINENVAATSRPNQETIESNEDKTVELVENISRKRIADQDVEIPIKQLKIDSDIRIEPLLSQGHDTHSDDDAPEEEPIQRQSHITYEETEKISGPTHIKADDPKKASLTKLGDKQPKRRTVLDMTRRIRNQNTLLEKLLQKDIRHERNVLLQCVRYVVENNFFGIGQKVDDQHNQSENI